MSIIVGRVENKFWENGGFKFPNSFPNYSERLEIKDAEPNLNDFLSGTIYLHGEHGNHCLYKGAYYNLHVFQVIDEAKKYYLYRLERDLWFDVLRDKPRVVGDLSTSNNDELLEANLNRTFSMLDNPARVVSINFGDVEFDWKKFFTFKEATKVFSEPILTENALNYFLATLEEPLAKDGKRINQLFYQGIKNPAVFILNYIEPHYSERNGKNLVKHKVNTFIKSIPADEGNGLKIAKVTAGTNGKLQGNYCITHKVDGISSSEENVRLLEVNLSGLEDIVPVNIHDLAEIEPYTQLGKGSKSGVFTTEDVILPTNRPLFKICRFPRLPISSRNHLYPVYSETQYHGRFNDREYNWSQTEEPEGIDGEYGGRTGKFYLWGLDNVNFEIGFKRSKDGIPVDYSEERLAGASYGGAATYSFRNINGGKDGGDTYADFPVPIPWGYPDPLDKLKNSYASFGFLIFGIVRKYDDGNLFEYKGELSRKEVKYGSGISSDLFKNYGTGKSEGGSDIDPKLRDIQPTEELTKFYLDNFNFLFLSFFPQGNTTDELGQDFGGTGKHTYNNKNPSKAMKSDIHDKNGKGIKENPYNDDRFPPFMRRVDQKLEENLLTTILELPEDHVLEKGDYFFNGLEYRIRGGRRAGTGDSFGTSYLINNRAYAQQGKTFEEGRLFTVEDFVTHKGEVNTLFPNGSILLCTDLNGGIDIRVAKHFSASLNHSDSDRQVIRWRSSVVISFSHFKKVSDNLIEDKPEGKNPEDVRVKIIEAFYKANGYKTKIIGGSAHGNGFDESDFDASSNAQLLFDLVGTDGYAFFAKGKVNLISKNTKNFVIQTGKTTTLLHKENKDLKPTILEKINQRVRLQFFEAPYYLNWKTTFSDADKINLSFETMATTELPTNFEQYFLRVTTGYDEIFYENVSVPKKQTKALSPADSVQIERFNLDLTHAQYGYQIDQNKLAIATKRYEEAIKRMEVNLHHQRIESLLTLGTTSAASGLGAGLSLKYGGGAKTITITNRKRSYQKFTGISEDASLDAMGALALRFKGGYALGPRENLTRKVITKPGKIPNVAAATGALALNMTKNLIMDHAFRFPELERQIGFEKQIGASELALQSLGINTSFMERQINDQLALNQITNVYDSPVMNERRVLDEFMSKSDGHGGKALKPAHLMVFIPSEEQLIRLKSFKEEYGVMCDIPDVSISFFEGMKPDVIRYRNLDKEAIRGIKNQIVLEYFRARLLAGIHIVGTAKERYDILTVDEYKDKLLLLNNKLSEETSKVIAKDRQITVLNKDIQNIRDSLTKAQKELEGKVDATELNKLKERNKRVSLELERARNEILAINEDKERLQKLIADKEKQIAELSKQGPQVHGDDKALREVNDRLNEEIRKHKVDLEECTQKLNDALRRAIVEKAEIDRLKKELSQAKGGKDDSKEILTLFGHVLDQVFSNEDISTLEETKRITVETIKTLNSNGDQSLVEFNDSVNKFIQARIDSVKKLKDCQGKVTDLEKSLKNQEALNEELKKVRDPKEQCKTLTKLLRSQPIIDESLYEEGDIEKVLNISYLMAKALHYLRKSGLDAEILSNYPILRKMMFALDKLTEFKAVDYGMSKLEESHGEAGVHTENINTLEERVVEYGTLSEVKGKDIVFARIGFDELNGESYSAIKEIGISKINSDETLRLLFKHIYPGSILGQYRETGGDPEPYLALRQFLKETKTCETAVNDPLDIIKNLIGSISYNLSAIQDARLKIARPVYYGYLLDTTFRYAMNAIPYFEDAVEGQNSFTRGTTTSLGMGQLGLRFGNYPYSKMRPKGERVPVIWMEFISSATGTKYDKFYLATKGLGKRQAKYRDIVNKVKYEGLHNRERGSLTDEQAKNVFRKGREAEAKKTINIVIDFITPFDEKKPIDEISLDRGDGYDGIRELNKEKDLLALISILEHHSIRLENRGKEVDNSYGFIDLVYNAWNKQIPSKEEIFNRLNSMRKIDLGLLFGTFRPDNENPRNQLKSFMKTLEAPDSVSTTWTVKASKGRSGVNISPTIYHSFFASGYLLSWIYKLLITPEWFEHPWDMFGGGMAKMVDRVNNILG